MKELTNNPYVKVNSKASSLDGVSVTLSNNAIAHELRSISMLMAYQDPSIMSRLELSEQVALQESIIERLALRAERGEN